MGLTIHERKTVRIPSRNLDIAFIFCYFSRHTPAYRAIKYRCTPQKFPVRHGIRFLSDNQGDPIRTSSVPGIVVWLFILFLAQTGVFFPSGVQSKERGTRHSARRLAEINERKSVTKLLTARYRYRGTPSASIQPNAHPARFRPVKRGDLLAPARASAPSPELHAIGAPVMPRGACLRLRDGCIRRLRCRSRARCQR